MGVQRVPSGLRLIQLVHATGWRVREKLFAEFGGAKLTPESLGVCAGRQFPKFPTPSVSDGCESSFLDFLLRLCELTHGAGLESGGGVGAKSWMSSTPSNRRKSFRGNAQHCANPRCPPLPRVPSEVVRARRTVNTNTKVENGKNRGAGVRGLAPAPFGEWSGTANEYPATSQTIPGLNLISTLLVSQSGLIVIAVRGCHHTARHTVQSPFHVRFISRARTHPRRTRRRHAKMPSIPAYRRRPQ